MPMTQWKALKIRVKRRYIDSLSGFLYPRGCIGISYDETTIDENSTLPEQKEDDLTDVTAYFSSSSDSRKVAKELRDFVSGLPRMDGSYAIESVEVQDFGWADKWKEFFSPIRIGRSITVTPSWEKRRASGGETVLVIDPGEAFGTGSHETTRLCIELIEREFEKSLPEKCLDIGCGTGILGILMAMLGAREVLGIDIDSKAVVAANENSRVNGTETTFRAIDRPIDTIREHFDFLSANIIAESLISMKEEIFSLLTAGGRAVLSGILIDKTEWLTDEFHRTGLNLIETSFLGTWSAVTLKKE